GALPRGRHSGRRGRGPAARGRRAHPDDHPAEPGRSLPRAVPRGRALRGSSPGLVAPQRPGPGGRGAMNSISTTGVGTSLRVQWRTGWKGASAWVIGLAAVVALTAGSITDLYDTPAKLRSYADSSDSPALRMLNGDVAGLGTLGGTLANELGFVFGFGLPVMAIALTVRGTRREEEAGRLELLLASRMGRQAPLVAAVLVALLSFLALGALTAVIFVGSGTEVAGALAFGGSIVALGAVFVGVTALLAQAFGHSRSVWGAGLAIMLVAYIVRGAGAIDHTWVVWL